MPEVITRSERDARINSIHHKHYVKEAIQTIAKCISQNYDEVNPMAFPPEFMMIGDDWLYAGRVNDKTEPISIDTRRRILLSRNLSVSDVFNLYYGKTRKLNIDVDEVSIIPETGGRMKEAKIMGDIRDDRGNYFTIMLDDKTIYVYRLKEFGIKEFIKEESDADHMINESLVIGGGGR